MKSAFRNLMAMAALLALPVSLAVPVASANEVNDSIAPHAQAHILVKVSPAFHSSEVAVDSRPVLGRWISVPVPPGATASQTVASMARRPGVERAELDYLLGIDPLAKEFAQDVEAVDDPYTSYQWHLPQVQAYSAWESNSGSGVVVAVIDSGISQGGEDLSCHSFVHPYNAITETEGASAADDDHGHGTHVAGTVAQCTDNGVGVAGVAFDASLMPVKVLDANGSGATSWIARGVDWARQHGADVINLSLGCSGACQSSLLDEAIEGAVDDGIVVVAASGNGGIGTVSYPASHPDTIAVGATDYAMTKTGYSNWGSELDLVAPGGDLGRDDNSDSEPDGVLQETFEYKGPNKVFGYYWYEGTSMATPHVAGGAALLKAALPGLSGAGVRDILESTALDLGAPGYDTSYGHGLVQIADALDYATAPDTSPPTWHSGSELVATEITGDSVALSWPEAEDDRFVAGYVVYRDGHQLKETGGTSVKVDDLDSAFTYEFEVRAKDGSANLSDPLAVDVTTLDVIAPSWTSSAELGVARYGETDMELTWAGSTDNVGVTAYRLRLVDTTGFVTGSRRANVTGLNPGSTYTFEVLARDQAGNWSEPLVETVRTARLFSDAQDHLFYEDILWLSGSDITRGCNPPVNDLFCPDDPVSRETVAAFLVRALGLKANSHPGFVDVPVGSTFAEDIGRLATAGITRGCNPPENDEFCPNDIVTRGQLAAFLKRAFG